MMELLNLIMPEQASTFAPQVDALIWALTALSAFFTIAVSFTVVLFTIRFHKSKNVNREIGHGGHTALELTWTIIPTFLALGIFVWSAYVFFDYRQIPPNAMEIQVSGKQWMWHIQHPNGRREVNTLTIPAGKPIKLNMWSQDVIHDFFIPDFRVKMDVLPGRITTLWFEADEKILDKTDGKPSVHNLFCAEFCGTEHSRMVGKVVVMAPEEYEAWLQTGNSRDLMASTPEAAGEKLFGRLGCAGCHAAGDSQRGPKLAGIWESEVKLEGGGSITVDEDYIRESILNPTAKVVSGYPKLMPTFKGQVSDTDIFNLIKYIQSLKKEG